MEFRKSWECGWCSCHHAPGLAFTTFFLGSMLAECSEDTSACWVIFSWEEVFLLRHLGEARWAGDGSAPAVHRQCHRLNNKHGILAHCLALLTWHNLFVLEMKCVHLQKRTVDLVAWRKQTNAWKRNPSPVSIVKLYHDTALLLFLTWTSYGRHRCTALNRMLMIVFVFEKIISNAYNK